VTFKNGDLYVSDETERSSFMNSWVNPGECDRRVFRAIEILLSNHPQLLDFLFKKKEALLSSSPQSIKRKSRCFSSGEQILIQIALDIWSGSGKAKFLDIVNRLDIENINHVISTMQYLNRISSVGTEPSNDY
jgi:hypothetical protein